MSTTTKVRPMIGDFRARLGQLVFTDRQAFEKAVSNYLGVSRHRSTFNLGDTVYLDYAGVTVTGQVWALAEGKGSYWIRGNDGVTYRISGKTSGWRTVIATNSLGAAISDDMVREIRGAA